MVQSLFPCADSYLSPTGQGLLWSTHPTGEGSVRIEWDPESKTARGTTYSDTIFPFPVIQTLLAQRALSSPRLAGFYPVRMSAPHDKLYTAAMSAFPSWRSDTFEIAEGMLPVEDVWEHVGWFAPGTGPNNFGAAFLYAQHRPDRESSGQAQTFWHVGFVGMLDPHPESAAWDDTDALRELCALASQPPDVHRAMAAMTLPGEYVASMLRQHNLRVRHRAARAEFTSPEHQVAVAEVAMRMRMLAPEFGGPHGEELHLGVTHVHDFIQSEVFGVGHDLPPVAAAVSIILQPNSYPQPAGTTPPQMPAFVVEAYTTAVAEQVAHAGLGTTLRLLGTPLSPEITVTKRLDKIVEYLDIFYGELEENTLEMYDRQSGGWLPVSIPARRASCETI